LVPTAALHELIALLLHLGGYLLADRAAQQVGLT